MFSASDSTPPISVTVSPEPSTTTIKALTADANGNPIPFTTGLYGTFVYIRADVTGQSGNGTATGAVTIKDNGAAIDGNPFPLNSQGNTATPDGIFTLPAGQHTITASYGGDASFKASPDASTNITITQVQPLVQVGAIARTAIGDNVDLVAVISGTSCGKPATGTMTFFTGTTQIGSLPIVTTINSPSCTLSGTLNFNTSSLPLGVNSITAKYSGDTNYAGATSQAAATDIFIPTTTTTVSSATTIQQGQSVTFTATVAPVKTGGPALTGTLVFSSSSQLCSVPISNNQGQCTTSALPVSMGQVNATYSGDSNYGDSTGSTPITVNPGPDFSAVASPASITIASPGQSGSTMLMLSAMNGLTGTFTLAPQCANLPSESTCGVSPASVTFSSTMTTASVMLTVTTTAPSSVAPTRRLGPPMSPGRGEREAIALCLLALLSILCVAGKRKRLEIALSTVVFAGLLAFAACGGGSGGGGGGVHNPGTPVGLDSSASVSLTLGMATHSVPFSVNVQ
jgi:hypothetical protein